MNPDAAALWRAPRWALAILLASLGMLGPFAIDTYIPAFDGIARALNATPLQMQQTFSAYLAAFAVMSLFHGALSDAVGRRPVVLWGLAAYTVASVGCALADSMAMLIGFRVMQGLSTGAGIVVSRAVVRDLFPPAQAQQMMSQITLFFGLAPAVAPLIGGLLFDRLGWQAVFWFLAGIGALLWLANWRLLPESLPPAQRQSLQIKPLMRGYAGLALDPRFMLLALSSGVPFNGLFIYVLSAPTFLGQHLHLAPTQFFWFFLTTISGIMLGAWWSGRLAGRISPERQIRRGLRIMGAVAAGNVLAHAVLPAHVAWALWPVALYAMGWALMMPSVTLLVLDLNPQRRGMASSLQAGVASGANALVAGLLAPWVMHSAWGLAWAALGLWAVGALAWWRVSSRAKPARVCR